MRSIGVVVLAVALLAAACSGGDSESVDESTTAPAVAATTAPATTSTEAATTTTAVTTQGGAECVVGTWELDSQRFFDSLFETFSGELGMEDAAFEHLSGSYRVAMASDGTFSGIRDEWTFRFTIPEGGFQTIIDGTDTGSYTIDEDQLTMGDISSDTTVTFLAEVDGEAFEIPSGPDVGTDALGGTGTFTCGGDVLTVTNEGIMSAFTRVG